MASACRVLAGACRCGAVRYAVADEFACALNCHCSNCRRTTGSAFRPFAVIERGKLGVTQGDDCPIADALPQYDEHVVQGAER